MTEKELDVRTQVLHLVRDAAAALIKAHQLLLEKNSMAGDVEVVKGLQRTAKDLGTTMQGIAKLRGLE